MRNSTPMRSRPRVRYILIGLLNAYLFTILVAAGHFLWKDFNQNGLVHSTLTGYSAALPRAAVWPYAVWDTWRHSPQAETSAVIEKLSEMGDYEETVAALLQKAHLTYRDPKTLLAECQHQHAVLSYEYQELELADTVDTALLDSIYPELGTRFRSQWTESLRLFIYACHTRSQSALAQSWAAAQQYADWFDRHAGAIDAALRAAWQNPVTPAGSSQDTSQER